MLVTNYLLIFIHFCVGDPLLFKSQSESDDITSNESDLELILMMMIFTCENLCDIAIATYIFFYLHYYIIRFISKRSNCIK